MSSHWLYRLNVWYDRLDPNSRLFGFFFLLGSILLADIGLTLLKIFPVGGMLTGIALIGLTLPRIWYIEGHYRPRPTSSALHVAASKPATDPDLKILGLNEMPQSMAILARAYRKAARSAHPDAGGSDAAFIAVRNAYLRIREGMRTIR